MRVLQIGSDDWSETCEMPKGVEWYFVAADDPTEFDVDFIGHIDVTILDALCDLDSLVAVDSLITPYTLLLTRHLDAAFDGTYKEFFARKAVVSAEGEDRQLLVDDLPVKYSAGQFGRKLDIRNALVSPFHTSGAWFEGSAYLAADIDHGDSFRQLMMWKENIRYENDHALELWPEYVRDAGCEIELGVQLIQSGTPDVIAFQKNYSEAEMSEPIVFSPPTSGYLSCSIFAKGTGQVRVGPIHYRHSRLGAGQFLPGGRRIVDSRREELFYYFHPGNLLPPLNIYFSGYRPHEGFEGYRMMAGLGHPFLLVTDARLEGGRFYIGSEELEDRLLAVIRDCIESLGLREDDVIFSGVSMGAFGALYYGSQFNAHAIVAGKPIVDLGYVAERGRLVRPDDFLTIFDIVNFWERERNGETSTSVDDFTQDLLARWHGEPGFGETKILMAYMLNDDYDNEAYYTLLKSQTGKMTTVIARGYQGRHNDDSESIVNWFSDQYRRVIHEYQVARGGEQRD